jgi:hypothetical protein
MLIETLLNQGANYFNQVFAGNGPAVQGNMQQMTDSALLVLKVRPYNPLLWTAVVKLYVQSTCISCSSLIALQRGVLQAASCCGNCLPPCEPVQLLHACPVVQTAALSLLWCICRCCPGWNCQTCSVQRRWYPGGGIKPALAGRSGAGEAPLRSCACNLLNILYLRHC